MDNKEPVYNPSQQIDYTFVKGVHLTLATWQPDPFYQPSYEIGFRDKNGFYLIQFSINHKKAWEIVKEMTAKGYYPSDIESHLSEVVV